MINAEIIFYSLGIAGFVTIIILSIVLFFKMQAIRQLQNEINQLGENLNALDEQAKLVIRTDMELNRTQDELDKKISSLYTLHSLSQSIASTLDETQIFNRINPDNLSRLGLEKALAFLWNEEKAPQLELNVGYNTKEAALILDYLEKNKNAFFALLHRHKTTSSFDKETFLVPSELKGVFCVDSFIISPILPKQGTGGFLFVGTTSTDNPISEGDKESIDILTNQIAQALDNARLFEVTWHAQQDLETKVNYRTRQLSNALEEIKQISERKTDFVSAVSHELRTPLTSIKGYASILLSGVLGEIPQKIRERLDKVNQHADELVHLVNDLLDIARIESGRAIMKRESQDIRLIIDSIAELLSVQMKKKEIKFAINIKEESVVFVDKQQIKRVFINLIGNAIKFTPDEGRIEVRVKPNQNFVQIDISDTGLGMPKEVQEKIFNEFYRVDNPINEEVKGTGLGLSLVKNIIEAHRGKIWVESELNHGSTFSFTLPRSK